MSESIKLGIHRRELYALRDRGDLEVVSRGLYRLVDMPAPSLPDFIPVAKKILLGIFCLISALAFHEITTQIPHFVYVALPSKAHKPAISHPPMRYFWHNQKLILRNTQTGGNYNGVSCSFSARLFSTKMPVLIDMGFSDIILPNPQQIRYPTLLNMPEPTLLGYTLETVIAEKLQTVVKLALVNTRMKDFYDLWTIIKSHEIQKDKLGIVIRKVFTNRKTPVAFTEAFYNNKETQKRWNNFLTSMGKKPVKLEDVILELSKFTSVFFENKLGRVTN